MSQKPEEHLRLFRISDVAMIEDSNTIVELFHNDKTDFIAFDKNTFEDPFEANYRAAITESENADTDELYQDQQQGKTQDVEKSMADCRKKYSEVKYFVLKNRSALPVTSLIQ